MCAQKDEVQGKIDRLISSMDRLSAALEKQQEAPLKVELSDEAIRNMRVSPRR